MHNTHVHTLKFALSLSLSIMRTHIQRTSQATHTQAHPALKSVKNGGSCKTAHPFCFWSIPHLQPAKCKLRKTKEERGLLHVSERPNKVANQRRTEDAGVHGPAMCSLQLDKLNPNLNTRKLGHSDSAWFAWIKYSSWSTDVSQTWLCLATATKSYLPILALEGAKSHRVTDVTSKGLWTTKTFESTAVWCSGQSPSLQSVACVCVHESERKTAKVRPNQHMCTQVYECTYYMSYTNLCWARCSSCTSKTKH